MVHKLGNQFLVCLLFLIISLIRLNDHFKLARSFKFRYYSWYYSSIFNSLCQIISSKQTVAIALSLTFRFHCLEGFRWKRLLSARKKRWKVISRILCLFKRLELNKSILVYIGPSLVKSPNALTEQLSFWADCWWACDRARLWWEIFICKQPSKIQPFNGYHWTARLMFNVTWLTFNPYW